MNVLQLLSVSCPNISAQRIYACLYMLNDERFGTLREISYEWLAVRLQELGFRTERGDRFTRRTVWGRLIELCRAGLADVDKNLDGSLDIKIVAPKGLKQALAKDRVVEESRRVEPCHVEVRRVEVSQEVAPESEESTSNDRALSFAARRSNMESTSHNGTDNSQKFEQDTKEEYIKINKQINKQISLNDAVAKVDFTSPQIARFREKVARAAYEVGMHADLIDRAVAAVALGYATAAELKHAIEVSKDAQRQLEKTNGFKGKRYIWQTLALYVKSWFDAAGLRWVPTGFRREPSPKPIVKFNAEEPREDDVIVDEKGRTVIRPRQRGSRFATSRG